MPRDLSPNYPATFAARYPRRACGGAPSDYWPSEYVSSTALSSITLTDNTAIQPQGVAGTTWTIRDSCQALYLTASGSPSNQTALDALCKQIFQDRADWQSQNFDTVINGIAAVVPNGLIDVVEFRYDASDVSTRITSAPWNGQAVEMSHLDPNVATSDCQNSWDRYPGILMDVPGADHSHSIQSIISLEDGRLVSTYDNTMSVPCGCAAASITVTGTLIGCLNAGLATQTITLTDHATMTLIGTIVTSGTGAISGSFTGTNGQTVDVSVTVTGGRFAAYLNTFTVASNTLALGSIAPNAASLYICTKACNLPLARSITWTGGAACLGVTYPNSTLAQGSPPAGCSCSIGSICWFGTANVTAFNGFHYQYYAFGVSNTGSLGFSLCDPTNGALTLGTPLGDTCPTLAGGNFSAPFVCLSPPYCNGTLAD